MAKDKVKVVNQAGPMGFVLFMSFVGALVYFVQRADGFWNVIVAVLKAAVWPAFLIHRAFELLNI
jgi:hypothetical protein